MKVMEIEEKVLWTPSPDWVQPVDWIEQELSEFSGQVLKFEKQVHIPKQTRYMSKACRLDNYEDIQHNSVLQIEFDPSYQKIHLHKLEVYRGEGKTRITPRYKQKLVQKENESHLYIFSGIWTLILIVEDLRVGDILDYSFSYEGMNASFKNQILESFYLSSTFPIKHTFCRIIADSDKLKFKNHNHENQPIINSLTDGLSEWIWDLFNLTPISAEYGQPSWFFPWSWVQITSFSSWKEVSAEATILFPKPIEPILEISAKIEQWKAQNFSVENLILDVIRFVQNEIRYLSLSDDMDAGQAADPNEVFLRRYGDCKDKTGLLCMLFRLLDIPALPALANTHIQHEVINWLPSPNAFNHAIVCFNFDKDTFWIDPTDQLEVDKVSQLPIPQLGYVLPIENPGRDLVELKRNSIGKISTTVHFELRKSSPDTHMSIMTNFIGLEAIYFRNHLKKRRENEIQDEYKNYYRNYYKEIFCKEDIKITDNRDENTILLKESYEIPNFGILQDNVLTYYFNPLSIYENLPNEIDLDRKSPIDLKYPIDVEEKIFIKSNIKYSSIVIDIKIENKYIAYNLRCYKQDKHTQVISHSLKTLKNHIMIEDFAEMKSSLRKIFEESSRVLQLPRSPKRKRISGWLIFWIIWGFIVIIGKMK